MIVEVIKLFSGWIEYFQYIYNYFIFILFHDQKFFSFTLEILYKTNNLQLEKGNTESKDLIVKGFTAYCCKILSEDFLYLYMFIWFNNQIYFLFYIYIFCDLIIFSL